MRPKLGSDPTPIRADRRFADAESMSDAGVGMPVCREPDQLVFSFRKIRVVLLHFFLIVEGVLSAVLQNRYLTTLALRI